MRFISPLDRNYNASLLYSCKKYKKENPFLQAKAGNSQWRRNFKNKAFGSNSMD